ncbi:hypothetical protein PEC331060_11370 [Pectobacterium carotovorum subsp. carotovorum]|nr:hypothetical protein PEC331060_11370 [Pectobacterium carotovorum subsp. carotovorum]
MLHVNISKMENAIGLGYLVGAISVGLVTLLANFFSYRENNDILDAASEIKQATDAWPRQMRLFTTPEGKGYKFSFKTRGVLELAWQEHAFGSIGHGAPTADLTPQSIDAIKQRCTTQVPYAPFITELGNANTGENFLSFSQRWNNHREINVWDWFLSRLGLENFRTLSISCKPISMRRTLTVASATQVMCWSSRQKIFYSVVSACQSQDWGGVASLQVV